MGRRSQREQPMFIHTQKKPKNLMLDRKTWENNSPNHPSPMRMRNPMKQKSKRRQFVELQDDRGFSPAQFVAPDPPIPWKAIGLASLLFALGSTLIVIGALIKLNYITSEVKERSMPNAIFLTGL
ncbi:hypothetical protein BX666DRAFT_493816 [Dichotomocladium elegans]|nr:hypothetical protein BX666DRAFT_493816 [Dichotomocladium elegans]